MKKQTLLVAFAMLMLACQPKNEMDTEVSLDYTTSDITFSEPAACSPPPVRETVKFVPPVIKDDVVEETTESKNTKSQLLKNKKNN